jgi:hypothetical protein
VHDGVWPEPGGGGYAIDVSSGSSEILIEDNVVVQANKVIVFRAAGAGSVVGYNYMDDAHILTAPRWQEVGLNASHMAGSHHVLFEGNESFNYDADCTHGNSIEQTVFRNHLTGVRRDYDDDPYGGNVRAAGLEYGAWWHSFVGNVLGLRGRMDGWEFEDAGTGGPAPWRGGKFIWRLGYDPGHWDQAADPMVKETTIRHGNFDFLRGQVQWDPAISERSLPPSLYLKQRPAFFPAEWNWPWVDPAAPARLYKLPAKERYDAGTPIR